MTARILILVGALAFGGCYRGSARSVSAGDLRRESDWELVSGVPFVRQTEEHQCGVAALTMVLRRWGVSVVGTDFARAPAADQGIAAGELRDLARRKGLRAFLIQGEEADLAREVRLNHPILVGLVQQYTSRAYAHYEVVTGINQRTRHIVMLDPARGLREDDLDSFAKEWGRAGRLALVVGPN